MPMTCSCILLTWKYICGWPDLILTARMLCCNSNVWWMQLESVQAQCSPYDADLSSRHIVVQDRLPVWKESISLCTFCRLYSNGSTFLTSFMGKSQWVNSHVFEHIVLSRWDAWQQRYPEYTQLVVKLNILFTSGGLFTWQAVQIRI